jgi:DNA-binding IclR family transcriptional regulator
LTDISKNVDLHKSTVYRLLSALMTRGYIEKRDTIYRLGLEFVELCSLYLNSLELKTQAAPVLRTLAQQTDQTVFLATLQENEVVYIDKMETFSSIRKYSIIGQRRPLYCTSLGKALIMDRTNEEIEELFKHTKMKALTPKTITDVKVLLKDIEEARKKGWTFDDEEYEPDVRCLGAPIYDYRDNTIAAVSTVWHAHNKTQKIKESAKLLVKAAAEISRHMGFRQ